MSDPEEADMTPEQFKAEEADMTPEQFKAALAELIAAATDDGVDPRGSWVYRADDPTETDWEVMIHELAGGSDD